MKSEVRIQGPNWKIIIPVTLGTISLAVFLSWWFENEVRIILIVAAGALGMLGFVGLLGYAGAVFFSLAEKYQNLRIITYRANKAQMESCILSFPGSQRQLISPNAPVRLIEATAGSYKQLPEDSAAGGQGPLDLLTVFTQATQSYACIGGQQTGKTYQMRHIAAYWLNKGARPVIVGPKWDKGEWTGCILFGGKGDFAEVSRGITVVRQIAQKRHQSDMSHKEHGILPVFFDDWTPIVDAVSNARELVLQATTLYASVNIILYFILHSDTANAWGVDRKGAALKDNFIKLFIVPHYDANGLIVRAKTGGYIKFPSDTVDYPVKLLTGPFAKPGVDSGLINLEPELNLEPEPSPVEAKILRLYRQGKTFNEIARRTFGSSGGNQSNKIGEILVKFKAV